MKAIYFSLSAKKNENINEYFETATKIFLIKFNFYEQDNQVVVLNKKLLRDRNSKKK